MVVKKPLYKIAITGAIDNFSAGEDALGKAKDIGRAVASRGHILITGSQGGFPMYSAIGAKEFGGQVVYISPASSKEEHIDIYRLDHDNADVVIYTGFGNNSSLLSLSRSADAVIVGCGKLDAIHEFNISLNLGKPIGVIKGDFKEDELLKKILGEIPKSHQPVVFEENPDKLVDKLIEMVINK